MLFYGVVSVQIEKPVEYFLEREAAGDDRRGSGGRARAGGAAGRSDRVRLGRVCSAKRLAKTRLGGAFGYLEKRPRPKKPRTTNTRMTMTTIQRIDTVILSLGACRRCSPPASSLLHPFTRSVANPGARGATLVGRPR